MKIYQLLLIIAALPFIFAFPASAQAQSESCKFTFTAIKPDYEQRTIRITWTAKGPALYNIAAVQMVREDTTIPDPKTGNDWRYLDLATQEGILDASNLTKDGKISLRVTMIDVDKNFCEDKDENVLEWTKEFPWKPPKIDYIMGGFLPDYKKGVVTFYLSVPHWEENINYDAWIDWEGTTIGSTMDRRAVPESGKAQVEIPISGVVLSDLEEALKAKLHVYMIRTRDGMEDPQTYDVTIQPSSPLSIFEKIGEVVMAVVNNQSIVAGIMLVVVMLILYKSYALNEPPPAPPAKKRPPKKVASAANYGANSLVQQGKNSVQLHQSHPAMKIRMIQTSTPTHENVLTLNNFPCIIGRNQHFEHGEMTKVNGTGFVNIGNDLQVSRRHLEIRQRGKQFYIANHGVNKTIVNGQPIPKDDLAPLSLTQSTVVEIGEQTKLELHPQLVENT